MRDDDLVLAKIEGVRQLLAEAKTIQEAKQIIDVAEAARVYAKQRDASADIVNRAGELKSGAEHLLGQMLKQTPKAKGGNPTLTGPAEEPVATLAELGISKRLSARSQKLASIPIDKVRETIEEIKQEGKEVSAIEILKRAEPKPVRQKPFKRIFDHAEKHWSKAKAHLDKIQPCDFSREKVLKGIIDYCQKRLAVQN